MMTMAGPGHGLTDHPKAPHPHRDRLIVSDLGESVSISPKKIQLSDGCTAYIGQSHVQGRCAGEDLKFPLLVKVLVGTRSGLVKWLEISGPACCALWVEINHDTEELSAPSLSSARSGELKFVYRFRSRHALVQPLLGGITALQILMQKGIQKKLEAFITGFGAWDCPRNSCESLGDQGERSFYCLRGKDCCSQVVGGTARIWQISSAEFKKLIDMLSPAGIVTIFQEVVIQVVEVPSFYDVPLQQLDLMDLITRHPYVIFVDGSDLVVAWQGVQGLAWALLNFDFSSGIILAAKGTSFHDLRNYFKLQTSAWTLRGAYGRNKGDSGLRMLGRNSNLLHWEEWQRTSNCAECAQASALGSFLCDLFHKDGNLSAAEIASAKTLKHLHSLWGAVKQIFPVARTNPERAPIWEVNTSGIRPTGVATREHHALLQLRSRDSLIRQNSLQFLLGLLPRLVSQNGWDCSAASSTDGSVPAYRQSKSNPVTFRSVPFAQKRWAPSVQDPRSAACSKIEYGTYSSILSLDTKSKISNLLLHGVMAAIRRRKKVFPEPSDEGVMKWLKVGSQTERALRAGKLNWARFYELKSGRSVAWDDVRGSYVQISSGMWRHLSEWVRHGFLETILEQLRDSDHFSGSVQEPANACLKVVSCVPGDGSSRLVQSLLSILQEKLEKLTGFGQLRVAQTQHDDVLAEPAMRPQGISDNRARGTQLEWQEESWLNSMQNILQLLSAVTSGSSVIAAGLVQCRGLNLIIETYNNLVRLSHVQRKRSMKKVKGFIYFRPGEITMPVSCTYGQKLQASSDTVVTRDTPLGQASPVTSRRTENYGGQAIKQPSSTEPYQVRPASVQNDGKLYGRLSEHDGSMPDALSARKSVTEGDTGDHQMLPEQPRPYIPRLSFPYLTRMDELSCASRTSSTSFINDSLGSSYLLTDSMSESLPGFNATSRVRCSFHNLLCEAKCHALSTLSSMLSVSSRTVMPATEATFPLDIYALAESLLAELIGGLSNDPSCVGVGSQILIYRTIFRLDRLYDTPASDKVYDIKYENCCSGREFSLVLLQSISRNLEKAINTERESMVTLRPSSFSPSVMSTNMMGQASDREAIDRNDVSSRFWIDIGLLLGVLANFVTQWPERGAADTVFRICGRQVSIVLDMLASLRNPASWSTAQVLAMQQLLRLVLDALQDTVYYNNLSLQKCTEAEEFIWKLAAGSPQRWSCIERFAGWVLLDACQSCTKKLVQTYHTFLQKPTACHLCKNGCLQMNDNLALNLQAWKKRLMKFLRAVVALIQRRVSACREVKLGYLSFPLPETMIWLLDFLMNPANGILIRMLKGPYRQDMIRTSMGSVLDLIYLQRDPQPQQKPYTNVLSGSNFSWKGSTTIEKANACVSEQGSLDCGNEELEVDSNMVAGEDHCTRKTSSDRSMKSATLLSPATDVKAGNSNTRGDRLLASYEGLCPTCKESGTITCDHNVVRQDALCLLADIFGLRLSASLEKKSNPLVIEGVVDRNPFLVGKYVDPFLDNLFSCFLQLYNICPHTEIQTDDSQMLQMATLKAKDISPSCPSGTTNRQSEARLKTESRVGSVSKSSGSRLVKSENLSTPASHSDEEVSNLCKLYGGVLLTLAQNQSEDVRKRFRQLHVMEFLIQQISLEYEAGHFASPRLTSGVAVDIVNPGAMKMDHSDLEDTTTRSRSRTESPGHKKLGSLSTEQSDDQLQGFAARNVPIERTAHLSLDEKQIGGIHPSIIDKTPRNCGQLLHEERDLCSVQKAGPQNDIPSLGKYFLGSVPSALNTRSSTHDVRGQRIPQLKIPQLKLNLIARDEVTNSCPVPRSMDEVKFGSGEQIDIEKQGAKEESYIASHQGSHGGGRCERRYQAESSSSEEKGFGAQLDTCISMKDGSPLGNRAGTVSTDRKEGERDTEFSSTFRSAGSFKYSGRFCDFNEEVDRELAEEEVNRYGCEGEGGGRAREDNYSDSTSGFQNASSRELEGMSQGHQIRPPVPKLNLLKPFRKELNNRADSLVIMSAKETIGGLDDEHSCLVGISGCGTNGSCAESSRLSYVSGRTKRRIYRNTDLHVLLLELVISLMLTPYGTLDAYYSDRFPMEKSKLNAPFFLSYHLNHPANSHVLPSLKKRTRKSTSSAYQILKLTCTALSNLAVYARQERIARGAFAQIYTALVTRQTKGVDVEELVVLKNVGLPKGPHDPCKFFDIYSEVQILSKFLGQPKVCQVMDYGVDCDSYVLVLKHYKCSLRAWREQHSGQAVTCYSSKANSHERQLAGMNFLDRLPLYLEIYSAVLNAVKVLELQNVVHYDLKCDNILLEPSDSSLSAEDFWDPIWPPADLLHTLPFSVCIADFGQSKESINQGGECTFRNRGTEYVRSPEMLKLLSSSSQVDVQLELQDTVGKAVDVWGLGCLLYELLTGEYLLYDEDWIQFFIRVTMSSEELITKEKAAKVENCPPIMHFLQFALVRDPLKRPSLDDLITRLKMLQTSFPVQGVQSVELHNSGSMYQPRVTAQNLQQVDASSPEPAVIVAPVHKARLKTVGISRIRDFLLCRCRSCSTTP